MGDLLKHSLSWSNIQKNRLVKLLKVVIKSLRSKIESDFVPRMVVQCHHVTLYYQKRCAPFPILRVQALYC